jgi:hypothetical protein
MRNGFHHGYLFNGNCERSSGHVMAALKGDGSIKKCGQTTAIKTILMINQINGQIAVWVIYFNESAMGRG